MKNLDIPYLCTIIGNLSGVPIRLYEGEERIFYHALVNLPKDPVELYREDIWKITDSEVLLRAPRPGEVEPSAS